MDVRDTTGALDARLVIDRIHFQGTPTTARQSVQTVIYRDVDRGGLPIVIALVALETIQDTADGGCRSGDIIQTENAVDQLCLHFVSIWCNNSA